MFILLRLQKQLQGRLGIHLLRHWQRKLPNKIYSVPITLYSRAYRQARESACQQLNLSRLHFDEALWGVATMGA